MAAVAAKDGTESPQTENKGKDIVVGGTTVSNMTNGRIEGKRCERFFPAEEPSLIILGRQRFSNFAM